MWLLGSGCRKTVRLGKVYGSLEFADFTGESKEKLFVYWKSIQEIADAIFKWADKNAKLGSVEAIVDICEDTDNKEEVFYKLPIEIVLKAC